jgi:amino acid transporter
MVSSSTPNVTYIHYKNYRLITIYRQADMASAMPTAGGLYFWTHYFAAEKWKNPLSFVVGYSNTIGLIGGICSIDCTL